MDFINLLFGNFETNLLIFARVIGIFAFNPIFSRRNVPQRVKVGASVLISAIAVMVIKPEPIDTGTITGVYLLMVIKEGFVGLVIGFITNMFFYSIQVGGELMDMQSGLGMAKVFDPVINTPSSIMGSIISFMMYLYFFATNAHLSYIRLIVLSYGIIPIAEWQINPRLGMIITEYFTVVLALVIKMALPIIVAEIIVQFCIGIMMKSVPQIQLMVVNIQLKVIFGFWILYLIAVPLSDFIDTYMDTWLETLEGVVPIITGV